MNNKLAVSLATVPLIDLKKIIKVLNQSPIEMLHFDIEDGHFVPSIMLGAKIIGDLRSYSTLVFDVHLMINNPERYIPEIVRMGGDRIAIHWEACDYPLRSLEMIKAHGIKAGLAFNPKTSIPDLHYLKPYLDFINILSSEPTEITSHFIPEINKKMHDLRLEDSDIECEVDGGVNPTNIQSVIKNGAHTIVAGRYIFSSPNIMKNIKKLISAIDTSILVFLCTLCILTK